MNKRMINALVVSIIFIMSMVPATAVEPGPNTHTASVVLDPAWTNGGASNDYTFTATHTGGDSMDEIRLYKSDTYSSFDCEEKAGWYLVTVLSPAPKEYCLWTALTDDDQIDAGNPSEVFEFSVN